MSRLTASHISLSLADGFSLKDISFSLEPGSFNLLIGPSGSGKTTLLSAVSRQLSLSSGTLSGSEHAAIIPQRPESILYAYQTPREYLLAALGQQPIRRISEALGYFSLTQLADSPMRSLSGGQVQLIAVAGAMLTGASTLLLDEPTAQLDPIAAEEFLGLLHRLCQELDLTVLLSEHRTETLFPACDQVLVLKDGALFCAGTPREAATQLQSAPDLEALLPSAARIWSIKPIGSCPLTISEGKRFLSMLSLPPQAPLCRQKMRRKESPVLSARNLWFRYARDGADILKDFSLSLYPSEILCIMGGNGTGKTTALGSLAGILRPYSGKLHGDTLLIPQDPRPLFSGNPIGNLLTPSNPYLDLLGLRMLLDRDPDRLSCGELQRAAMAYALNAQTSVLLLDEPTRGMDPEYRSRLVKLLRKAARSGTAFLIISHDAEFCAAAADRCGLFFDGSIIAEAPPEEFFSGNLAYTTAANRMCRQWLPNTVTLEALSSHVKKADS